MGNMGEVLASLSLGIALGVILGRLVPSFAVKAFQDSRRTFRGSRARWRRLRPAVALTLLAVGVVVTWVGAEFGTAQMPAAADQLLVLLGTLLVVTAAEARMMVRVPVGLPVGARAETVQHTAWVETRAYQLRLESLQGQTQPDPQLADLSTCLAQRNEHLVHALAIGGGGGGFHAEKAEI